MGRIFNSRITNFSGGLSDDPRNPDLTQASLVKHFDIYSNPNKLIPVRSSEADENDGSTVDGMKQYNVYHPTLGTDGKLYGMGVTAGGLTKIVSKANPITGNWTLEATAEATGARVTGAFIEWQSEWWFFSGTNRLSKWAIGGSVTNTVLTLSETITTVAHGIIGQDNNLYMFYNDKVIRIDPSGTATDEVMSAIPSDMRITSVARYGDFLAIGCAYGTSATATPAGRSQVFLWDLITDTTVEDVIDWGEGALHVLGNIDGALVGVSNKYLTSSLGQGTGSMDIRLWQGGIPLLVKSVEANQEVTAGRFIRDVVIKGNKFYWVASVPFGLSTSTESTFHLGIWSFGRKNATVPYALSLSINEEAIDTSNFKINSFGAAGEYFFINHSADGSFEKMDDSATFTYTSIYDTQILNGSENGLDSTDTKKLLGVKVFHDALASGASTTVRYRKDEETSYTAILTSDTDNAISKAAINDASGNTLPEYKEITFRIESTGNAKITGILWQYEVIPKDIFDK